MIKKFFPFLTLFLSLSTLMCCALPALLVTVGLGASLASFLGNYPQLIWLSEHKTVVFSSAAAMLFITGYIRWNSQDLSCPTDPQLAKTCKGTKRLSSVLYFGSVAIFAIGAFFAFLAPVLFY